MHALNYCMLLPGPEAQQLAIYIGWLMHRTIGGIVAGAFFVIPSIFILLALSYTYAAYGNIPAVAGVLSGFKPVVVAIVVEAIGEQDTGAESQIGESKGPVIRDDVPPPAYPLPSWPRTIRAVLAGIVLWLAPIAALIALRSSASLHVQEYLFFSKAAYVTFGGAYAVLAYVTQAAVNSYGWVTHTQAVDGLALAETTPGPLIMVLQFIGFMAAWNNPGTMSQTSSGVLES